MSLELSLARAHDRDSYVHAVLRKLTNSISKRLRLRVLGQHRLTIRSLRPKVQIRNLALVRLVMLKGR